MDIIETTNPLINDRLKSNLLIKVVFLNFSIRQEHDIISAFGSTQEQILSIVGDKCGKHP
jgi:hypothetical protein